jgi:hypothetical protein
MEEVSLCEKYEHDIYEASDELYALENHKHLNPETLCRTIDAWEHFIQSRKLRSSVSNYKARGCATVLELDRGYRDYHAFRQFRIDLDSSMSKPKDKN